MIARLASAAAAAAVVGALIAGCSAPSEPAEPTPLFTSEEQAFAAAEETYRAYVEALNDVDLSDPETFEDVYAWTTGEANAAARESFSQMHADGWTVSGASQAALVAPVATHATLAEVELAVCLDVSDVKVLGSDGTSVVAPDRGQVQSMTVLLEASPAVSTGLAIASISGRDGSPACDS